jgi:hypothetical protein
LALSLPWNKAHPESIPSQDAIPKAIPLRRFMHNPKLASPTGPCPLRIIKVSNTVIETPRPPLNKASVV